MRKLSRRPLSAAARTALETLQSQVDDAPDPKATWAEYRDAPPCR